MVKRTLKPVTHQLVGVSAGEVTTRCGQVFKKPRVGFGQAAVFHWTCPVCDDATEDLLATIVAAR